MSSDDNQTFPKEKIRLSNKRASSKNKEERNSDIFQKTASKKSLKRGERGSVYK